MIKSVSESRPKAERVVPIESLKVALELYL